MLDRNAMLVRLSISQFTARKASKKGTEEICNTHHTDSDWARASKTLVAKKSLEEIQKIANDARTFHYANTLAWSDDGARILPAANFSQYSQEMRKYETEFELAVGRFLANYPSLIDEARIRLNGLFDENDYPSVNVIERKFGWKIQIDPVPAGDDFRVNLAEGEGELLRAQIENRMRDAQTAAMKDAWTRLHGVLAHAAAKLAEPDSIFRNSLIGNVRELCELLPRLNVANDPALDALARETMEKIGSAEPDTLRVNQGERARTADAAADILAKLAGYV